MSLSPCRSATLALMSAWLAASLVAGDAGGNIECPCLNASSSAFASLQDELLAIGRSASYGTEGCQAYDEDGAEYGCDAESPPPFCSTLWCYVDMSLCPINKGLCEEAGGTVGSDVSPHCRTRNPQPSPSLPSAHLFSYETCNNLNTYYIEAPVSGTTIKGATDVWPPYIVLKTRASGKTEYGGVIWDFFAGILQMIEPEPPRLQLVEGWATEVSRAVHTGSSYTACVHDVGLGNFDLCIADVWHTPEREQMVQFSPPLRHDYFYLITKMQVVEDSWARRLERPFLPFTPGTWFVILGFLSGMWLLLWLLKVHSNGCFGYKVASGDADPESCGESCWESGLEVFDDFLHRSSNTQVDNCPAKMFRLGFQFFLLVFSCSYTASLASMLVVQKQQVGDLQSIEEAIEKEVLICAPSAIILSLRTLYPDGNFVDSGDVGYAARFIHQGRCTAWVGAQDDLGRLHAGYYRDRDCQEVADGLLTEEEAACSMDSSGQPRDDCLLDRVGDIVLTVPIAFPLSDRVARSLSFSIINYIDQGGWKEALRKNEDNFPKSKCDAVEKNVAEGLDIKDLSGTLVITVVVVSLGVVFVALQSLVNLVRPKGDAGKTITRDDGKAIIVDDGKTTKAGHAPAEEHVQDV